MGVPCSIYHLLLGSSGVRAAETAKATFTSAPEVLLEAYAADSVQKD